MPQAILQDRATAAADSAANGLDDFHLSNDSAAVTAVLARVSSDQGGASASVHDQLVAARTAAAQLGWPVAAEYDDADISASRFSGGKKRPGWQALLAAIASGQITRVIVWAPNRASREMEDWSSFLNLCRRHRVLICVISHGNRVYDTGNARDRRTLMEDGIDAEYDSEKISQGVRRGIAGAQAAGKPQARMPYGYVKVHDGWKKLHVELDAEAAARVRQVFGLTAEGHNNAEVARRTGLSRGLVSAIIRNRVYTAKRILGDGTIVECQWPAIVDDDLFNRCQVSVTPQGAKLKGVPKSTYRSLLGGLGTCGKCGGKVTTQVDEYVRRGRVRRYKCSVGHFKLDHIDDVDERVGWEVVKFLMTPGSLEKYLPDADADAAAAARGQAESLRAELAEWAADLDVSRAAYKAREARIMPLIEAAEERARTLSVPPAVRAFADRIGFTGDGTATAERLNAAMQVWQSLPMEAARALLREVGTVTIYPQKLATELGKDQVEVLFG